MLSRTPQRHAHWPRLEALEGRALLSNAGTLDPTFGSGGTVTTAGGRGVAEALQTDGKILVAGIGTSSTGTQAFRLARYNTNGTLDSSFGSGGTLTTTPTRYGGAAGGVAIQADGKIVAVGTATVSTSKFGSPGTAFAIVRYNTDGSLDTTFGGGRKPTGIVVTNLSTVGPNEGANSVLIQPDGKIVVVGTVTRSGSGDDIAVVRYNANGTLDTAFGSGGVVFTSATSVGADAGNAATLQSDGKIVVAGGGGGTGLGMEVARYLPNGQLDSSFGTGGLVTGLLPPGDTEAVGRGIIVQADGTIVVAGDAYVTGSYSTTDQTALARLDSSGHRDATFGSSGYATTMTPTQGDAIALAGNGDLLVAGVYANPNTAAQDFGLAAFLPGGAPDTTVGTNGFATADFNGGADTPAAILVQPDGGIVVAGQTYASNAYAFAVARFVGFAPTAAPALAGQTTIAISAPVVRVQAGRTGPACAFNAIFRACLPASVLPRRPAVLASVQPRWWTPAPA